MSKSVGLILMVRLPNKEGKEVLHAMLSRRGSFNTEKMGPESYPWCCQVTAHGKLEEGEDFQQAIIRESCEELGEEFTETNAQDVDFEILSDPKSENKDVVTYGAIIPAERIKMLHRGPDGGEILYVTAEKMSRNNPDLMQLVRGEKSSAEDKMKIFGPSYTKTIAMFPDEIQMVRKAFQIFSKR